ncbi:MAG: hypothetical protein KDE31_09555, partial [Caldilineaceae bacterium]|nr:hypothetical protein [Caldilineaceae bacterium]
EGDCHWAASVSVVPHRLLLSDSHLWTQKFGTQAWPVQPTLVLAELAQKLKYALLQWGVS